MAFRDAGGHLAIDLDGGTALFTTRHGGVSEGPYASLNLGPHTDDDPVAVQRNRERAAALAGAPLAGVHQVHGTEVVEAAAGARPDADGLVTARAGLAPLVLVADCVPIALVAPEAVGVLHAGWRGLHDGIVAAGVRRLRDLGASRVAAAVGPAIGPCCYEVGDELRAAFGHRRAQARPARHRRRAAGRGRGRRGARRRPVHLLHRARRRPAVLLPPARPRRHRPPGGDRMAELIRGLDPGRIAERLAEIRAAMGRDDVEVLAAVKYVAAEELGALAEAGVTVAGENRAQELEAKAALGLPFTWDFIGQLQSRKVKAIVPLVRYVHSVCTDSALAQLEKHATPDTRILVEVNVAEEEGKAGVAPADLGDFIARSGRAGIDVVGLMTMPPLASKPEDSRRWFAALAQLAADNGLRELSMGTTQDYAVAAQEGATIVRIGTRLYT